MVDSEGLGVVVERRPVVVEWVGPETRDTGTHDPLGSCQVGTGEEPVPTFETPVTPEGR